jgi:hypothetical protein
MRYTPGALWLRFHQTFGRGPRVAWYRDAVRPSILSTPPIENTIDKTCEVHVLTCADDWLNLVWTLKSFYIASGRRYALCIHDDGSLGSDAFKALGEHFPAARIIPRAQADARLAEELRGFPLSHQFRNTNVLAPKVFDFMAFLTSDRMAIFDSDLLFFSEPTIYLQRIEDYTYRYNTFNADDSFGYTVVPERVREMIGHPLAPLVNTGFGLVHRNSIRWDWTEEFLALPGILDGKVWEVEQTIIALCSSRYGVELLPDEYSLRLEPGLGARCFRHYVGFIRHLMYSEGIARLAKDGFLDHYGKFHSARRVWQKLGFPSLLFWRKNLELGQDDANCGDQA